MKCGGFLFIPSPLFPYYIIMQKNYSYYKRLRLKRIEQAMSKPFPQYWIDALEIARLETMNRNDINAHFSIDVICPTCNKYRPVRIQSLYDGKGVERCAKCSSQYASDCTPYETRIKNMYKAQKASVEKMKNK